MAQRGEGRDLPEASKTQESPEPARPPELSDRGAGSAGRAASGVRRAASTDGVYLQQATALVVQRTQALLPSARLRLPPKQLPALPKAAVRTGDLSLPAPCFFPLRQSKSPSREFRECFFFQLRKSQGFFSNIGECPRPGCNVQHRAPAQPGH